MTLTDTKIRTFKIPDKHVKLADGGGSAPVRLHYRQEVLADELTMLTVK